MQEFIDFVAENVKHVGLREGLIGQARANNLPFAWEMTARYLAASDDAKLDIEAFFEPMEGSEETAASYVLALKHQRIEFKALVLGMCCSDCGKEFAYGDTVWLVIRGSGSKDGEGNDISGFGDLECESC